MYFGSNVKFLEQKSVVCYNYVDSFACLDEPPLTARETFFNKLERLKCFETDYAHAQQVFEHFQCESIKDYMQLYR